MLKNHHFLFCLLFFYISPSLGEKNASASASASASSEDPFQKQEKNSKEKGKGTQKQDHPSVTDSMVNLIVTKLTNLRLKRENLTDTLITLSPDSITQETFKAVCAPVGMELKTWASENGFKARQLSHKARNPDNQISIKDPRLTPFFKKEKPTHLVQKETFEGLKGISVSVPIYVTQGCLLCHGEQTHRPSFIKKNYTQDQAFNFKVGDLRGIFWVWKNLEISESF
jgi:hypothetical protein